MAPDHVSGTDAPGASEDDADDASSDEPVAAEALDDASSDESVAADGDADRRSSAVDEAEAEAADQAVADAIARYSTRAQPGGAREQAVQHAAHESMAAIEKFLGLARAAGSPGRESVWVGRVLKHRVKAWQLVYDFDADFAYVARMDRGIYLTTKGTLLFTIADSKPLRRRVAWKTSFRTLDTFLARYAGEHEVLKVPLLHHRRLLEGIARVCAQQHLDWR